MKLGRRPKLTEHQRVRAIARLEAGDSARAIGRDMNVSHQTIGGDWLDDVVALVAILFASATLQTARGAC